MHRAWLLASEAVNIIRQCFIMNGCRLLTFNTLGVVNIFALHRDFLFGVPGQNPQETFYQFYPVPIMLCRHDSRSVHDFQITHWYCYYSARWSPVSTKAHCTVISKRLKNIYLYSGGQFWIIGMPDCRALDETSGSARTT